MADCLTECHVQIPPTMPPVNWSNFIANKNLSYIFSFSTERARDSIRVIDGEFVLSANPSCAFESSINQVETLRPFIFDKVMTVTNTDSSYLLDSSIDRVECLRFIGDGWIGGEESKQPSFEAYCYARRLINSIFDGYCFSITKVIIGPTVSGGYGIEFYRGRDLIYVTTDDCKVLSIEMEVNGEYAELSEECDYLESISKIKDYLNVFRRCDS